MVARGGAEAVAACQIVLAAGRSLRMGQPKPLLRFGERTALELVLGAAAGAGVTARAVVLGARAEDILTAHRDLPHCRGVTWVRNPDESSAQLRSLQLGIEAARRAAREPPAAFFIHPVDFPLVLPGDYRLLLDALAAAAGRKTVFFLSHGGRRGHPVLCRSAVADKLLELGPGATAREVLEQEDLVYVLTPNPAVREDMDTPADYERLRADFLEREGR